MNCWASASDMGAIGAGFLLGSTRRGASEFRCDLMAETAGMTAVHDASLSAAHLHGPAHAARLSASAEGARA